MCLRGTGTYGHVFAFVTHAVCHSDSVNHEQAFVQLLKSEGIAEDTIEVLCSEAIISKQILSLLHEEHLQKLLGKIRIGEHAILTSISWRLMVLGVKHHARNVSCSVSFLLVWVF